MIILRRLAVFTLTVILYCSSAEFIYAQDFSQLQKLGTVNIDELTDDQIGQLVQRLEASGMSENQLIEMAKARGMSETDIAKLRARILSTQEEGKLDPKIVGERIRLNPIEQTAIDELVKPLEELARQSKEDSLKLYVNGLEVFGLRFFRSAKLSFEPNFNQPTPQDYVLGPGDEIYIDIWGSSEMSYQLTVSPEGLIRIPSLGPVRVMGMNMEAAKSKIINRLKRIYSSIGSTSMADVSLGNLRTIKVHVSGAVSRPGTYKLSSFNTVINALYSAAGPTINGSLRKIDVYRGTKLLTSFDAYKFFLEGSGNNVTLKDQDIIVVQDYVNRVRLEGEVKRPAYYELKEDETFADLIGYAGGFHNNAYIGMINVQRKEDNFVTIKSIAKEDYESVKMKDGDQVMIDQITGEFRNMIALEGPVKNPGNYEFREGLMLSQLIDQADGLRGETFMKRGVIIREEGDLSLSSISFNPKDIIDGVSDVELQSNDLVRLHSIHDLREGRTLKIDGEVLKPGTFDYSEGMTVENLIFLAEGFKVTASKSMVEVARRARTDSAKNIFNSAQIFNFEISDDLSLSDKDSQFKLEPYDLVIVRKNPFYQKQELVEIEGEVLKPGKYVLETKDERISSILKRSGGLSPFAYAKGATLIRRTPYFVEAGIFNEEGELIKDQELVKQAEIRKKDLSYRFKKEGFKESDSLELFRGQESIGIDLEKIIANPGSKFDLILRKGDIISIPREYQTVRVRGEVLYPSNIRHDNTSGFKRYIAYAGGFDQQAKKSKSYIIYANGSAAQTRSFLWFRNYPKVEPGAEIVIPKKPERPPLSPQAWVGIASSIATIALIVNQIATQ